MGKDFKDGVLWDGGTAVIVAFAKLTSFPRVYTSSRDPPVIPACLYVIPATPPSFPRTREPREKQSTPFPSLRVLCTTSQTTDSRSDHMRLSVARPLWIPAFAGMTVVMHSSPSRSEGDACEARRGCPKITTILTSFTRLTVIPATPPSFPRVYTSSHDSSVIPASNRHSRDSSVIPRLLRHSRGRGIQRKTKHAVSLPFAERRGRVRSTQGMPENHHNPHVIHASNRQSRDTFVIPACLYFIPRLLRHSRGRGNPEKDKARRLSAPTETVVFMFLGSRVRGNDMAWAGMT